MATPWFYDAHFAEKVKVWPAEPVVEFFERHRAEFIDAPVLDHGCGAGRHSIYMARRGANVSAIDFSEVGIRHSQEWATRERLAVDFKIGDFRELPYHDGDFAALVSWGSAFYGEDSEVRQTVREILRVLRPGARFLVMLKATNDFRIVRFGRPGTHTCDSDHGLPMTGLTRDEVAALFVDHCKPFAIESYAFSMNDGRDVVSNFLVSGVRDG